MKSQYWGLTQKLYIYIYIYIHTHIYISIYIHMDTHIQTIGKHFIMEAVVCHSVSHSISLCPHIFTCKCSLQWVIGLVWGLWLLLHYQSWILTKSPLGYPAVALCHEDPAALDLQDWSLHTLQQFIDRVDVGVGQLKALNLGLGGSWVVQLTSSPAPISPVQALQHCPC